MSPSVVERVGTATLRHLGYVGALTIQFGNALGSIGRALPFVGNRHRWKSSVQQMLAVGVHGSHRPSCQPLAPAIAGMTGLRREDLEGHALLEHRPDAIGCMMDRVALGHCPSRSQARSAPPRAGCRDQAAPAPCRWIHAQPPSARRATGPRPAPSPWSRPPFAHRRSAPASSGSVPCPPQPAAAGRCPPVRAPGRPAPRRSRDAAPRWRSCR